MRVKFTREFCAPTHPSAVIHNKARTAVVYLHEYPTGRVAAVGFYGKAIKPTFNYSFATAERRAKYVADWFASVEKSDAAKADRRAKRKAFRHTLRVGDVLRSSWGYDQTNIDYYQVTALIGEHVIEARPIAAESEETAWLQGKCVPAVDQFTGPAKRYRPTEGNAVKVRSFAWAYPCEGREIAGTKVYDASHWTAYA